MSEVPSVAECRLLDGFGQFIQIACGLLAFSALIIKRLRAPTERPLLIWALDVSKQSVSMAVAHSIGMLAAVTMSSTEQHASACSWYLVVFTVDVSLGVMVSLALLRVSQHVAAQLDYRPLVSSGDYGHVIDLSGKLIQKPSMRVWAIQMAHWTFGCVGPARFFCLGVVYLLRDLLGGIASGIHSIFSGHPHVELVFVMLVGPLLLNALQFLVQDAILRRKKSDNARDTESRALVDASPPSSEAHEVEVDLAFQPSLADGMVASDDILVGDTELVGPRQFSDPNSS